MSDDKGIKECLDVLQGIKDIVVDVKKVLANGKVGAEDIVVLMDLMGQVGELTAAVKEAPQVPAELVALSPEEATQLAAKAMEIVAAFKAA